MAIVPPGIRGAARLRIVRAHRVLEYIESVNDFYAGKCSLGRMLIRVDKMLEIGIPPVRNK